MVEEMGEEACHRTGGAAEAREAAFRILRVVFPLRQVLRGELPLSALVGWSDMAYSIMVMFVSMGNSLWSMSLSASITEAIYLRNVPRFGTLIVLQLVTGFGENFLYSLREWFRERVARKWREVLTHYLHDHYFARAAFYRQQLRSCAVKDADERICQDVMRVVESLSWTLDSTASGVLTAVWNSVQLAWRAHPYYVVVCALYCWGSIQLRHLLSPALAQGQLGGKVAEVTGRYFGAHQKLVQHSEAIAAAGGGSREKLQIEECFSAFLKKWHAMCLVNLRSSFAMRVEWSILQSTFMNILTHAPFLRTSRHRLRARVGATESEQVKANAAILSNMVFQQRLIMRCMHNLSQLFRINRSLLMLSGTTTRIAELMEQLNAVTADDDEKEESVVDYSASTSALMQLVDVDIDSPTGERLVSGLSLTISTGNNLLIQGENGRGKTAIFRTLHGLWPVAAGRIMYCRKRLGQAFELPSGCLYLAQTPYIVRAASLQDQVTFPLQLPAGSVPKEQLMALLAQVGLFHETATSLEHWHTQQHSGDRPIDWEELLTYSDRQRMAIARIFYHKPRLVVVDEATYGLGMRFDRECLLEPCRNFGITVVMISQQRQQSMLQFYDEVLTLDGNSSGANGGWELTEIDAADHSPLMRTLTAEINKDESFAAEEQRNLSAARAERQRLEQRRSAKYQQQEENQPYQKREVHSRGQQIVSGTSEVPTARMNQQRDQASTFRRVAMVTRVLFPRVSLYDYAIQRVLLTLVFMGISIYTSNRVMSELPGQLQALAIQNDLMGYVRLTISGTVIRSLSMVMDLYLTWLNNTLSLHWQEALTAHVMDQYCARNAFGQIISRGLTDSDTRITSEIIDACERAAGLLKGGMGNWGSSGGMTMGSGQNWGKGILRPICDAAYMTILLIRVRLPTIALLTIWGYGTVGILLIKAFAPDFSEFQRESSRSQGELRSAHARLKGDGELIALSGAGDVEKALLNAKLGKTLAVGRREANRRLLWMPFEWLFTYSVPSSITQALRLVWSLGEGTDSEIMANAEGTGLSSTGQYIELLTERAFRTFGSILELHTELGRLFGVVRRVTDLMLTLQQLQEKEAAEHGHVSITYGLGENAPTKSDASVLLSCHDMDVVAPDGRCLAAGLTFKVCEKEHMLITAASSGSGKSALFRHLTQLWPVRSGQLVLPGAAEHGSLAMCFVSQTPLVPTVTASLLEMVTYGRASWSLSKYGTANDNVDPPDPNTVANVLEMCHLGSILAREGLDSNKRWDEVLSVGEQQCLAIARVVYHKPKVVVIDEGFSAVSSGIQALLLQTLDDCGVTVFCITSRLASDDLHRFFFHSTLELGCPNECGWHLDLITEDDADTV
eukprot:COSAG02_NODE_833_length_16656_cov_42.746814_9_plen_1359_part_00